MAINLLSEELIGFSEAARLCPGRRGNGRAQPSTAWRWAKVGVMGPDGSIVRLEMIRLGGRCFTSRQAVQRFADAMTAGGARTPPPSPAAAPAKGRTPAQRRRSSERAAQKLAAAGI
jgi:Protein of unknown function (DUF1580)